MRLRALLTLALALPAGCGDGASESSSPCGAVRLEPAQLGDAGTRALTLCLINAERAKRGLAPLVRRDQLELASQRHSEDMVARRFFEHDTPEGTDPQQRMLAAGYPADNAYTGENIAWAGGRRASPWEIVDLWMHSPPHRENILRPGFTEVGIGLVRGAPEPQRSDGVPWTYTTDFGGPPLSQ
ncbi:MAG: CAP domain-containing protein [Thermoleophilaceae bacterium]|nr:CAP domain-containing protein [Thermoleophilaceae bacterium]